jgi:hypothetical protein
MIKYEGGEGKAMRLQIKENCFGLGIHYKTNI